jgi:hypothetical protein
MNYEVETAEFEDACGDGNDPRVARALRKVVELHKPFNFEVAPDEYELVCDCQVGAVGFRYPCSTIQAIEMELL